MSAQFTPGPWTLTHVQGSNFAVQEFSIRGMFGEKPNVYPIFNRDTSAIDGETIYTSPANARLIAAAPELYDLLGEAVTLFANGVGAMAAHTDADNQKHCGIARDLISRIDAALAKARGEA